jgi:hypothetical protein
MRAVPERTLTLREINRATLARQMLLERHTLSVPKAIERLAGLQAQAPAAPYIGLWTRLFDFRRADLTRLLLRHKVVKATMMRATLHLVTAADYLRLRPAVQPALTQAVHALLGRQSETIDVNAVVEAGRAFLHDEPRTFVALRSHLAEFDPQHGPHELTYVVRTHLPLVQVPTGGEWGFRTSPSFIDAETWLGKPIPTAGNLRDLLWSYLRAFGPATVSDFQTWSGMAKAREAIEEHKPLLCTYRDEKGAELLDLPELKLPDADTPAPVRFLPEYDNLLLSHAKRTRILADTHRKRVYLPALRVASTFLVDGFVHGAWKIERTGEVATLRIEPFEPLSKADRVALEDEGERLVRFVAKDVERVEVTYAT